MKLTKVLAAGFSMALVLGLAGCGSSSEGSSSEESSQQELQQYEGLTDEASVAKARELMESLFAQEASKNYTVASNVTTITEVNGEEGSNTKSTLTMLDLTGDQVRGFISSASEPADGTEANYYINGKEGVLETKDEKVSIEFEDSYLESLSSQAANGDARVYYDCAESISYFEKDGTEVVQLQVNPEQLMASGILPDFTQIDSCVAEYTFNEDGTLSVFLNTIKGTLAGDDGTSQQVTMETKTIFTDYGTTEVPELPSVDEEGGEEGSSEESNN